MRIRIKSSGIEQVKRKYGSDAADDLVRALDIDIFNEVRRTAGEAADESPVETGALQASIRYSPRREGKLKFYWGSRIIYALRQEYEHVPKQGWQRRAWHAGNERTLKVIGETLRKRLE